MLLLLLLTACSKSPAPQPATATAPRAWSWESYPLVDKMRLGTLQCRVFPKASVSMNSPVTGVLRVYVDKQQTNVPAGFVWAEFEPERLAAEAAALEEARKKLDERERMLLTLELPKQKLKLAKDMEEAERQVAIMEMLSTNQSLAGVAAPLAGLKERSFTQETLRRAREELQLMREGYCQLEATNLAVLGVDLETARTELKRRQLDFERGQTQARLKVPFASQLNVSFQLAEGVTEYPVNSGQELGVLRDMSSILLRVILSDASWSSQPPENLKGVIGLPDGSRLEASFAFKRLEKIQQREDVVYYFEFATNRMSTAARFIGTDLSCELWLKLPERARVIPKLTLVINHPSNFQNRRWNEGVAQLARGARVLVEGQTDLAIALPNVPHKPPQTENSNE